MKYKTIPILIFFFLSTLLTSAYAQPQIGKKASGFITSTFGLGRIGATQDRGSKK